MANPRSPTTLLRIISDVSGLAFTACRTLANTANSCELWLQVQTALTWQLTIRPSCPEVVSAEDGALAAVVDSVSSIASVCMKFLLDMVEPVALWNIIHAFIAARLRALKKIARDHTSLVDIC